ncbi:hypothetical protein TNCV_2598121 [Trichonephila clavipes]|nr:hypothetical protein TNCV_2598121 [Trichonephila clavipes]
MLDIKQGVQISETELPNIVQRAIEAVMAIVSGIPHSRNPLNTDERTSGGIKRELKLLEKFSIIEKDGTAQTQSHYQKLCTPATIICGGVERQPPRVQWMASARGKPLK